MPVRVGECLVRSNMQDGKASGRILIWLVHNGCWRQCMSDSANAIREVKSLCQSVGEDGSVLVNVGFEALDGLVSGWLPICD